MYTFSKEIIGGLPINADSCAGVNKFSISNIAGAIQNAGTRK